MTKTCPGCGYHPIGMYTDQCPMCAEPVRGGLADDMAGGLAQLPPAMWVGWVLIGVAFYAVFPHDYAWLGLCAAVCGYAWWVIVREDRLLLRLVAGSLLGLFAVGLFLATQPSILPGLGQRTIQSPEDMMREVMAMIEGGTPFAGERAARMRTLAVAAIVLHVAIVWPVALCVPPFLRVRQRRQLGGPVLLTKQTATIGLVVWLALLPVLGWFAWPTVQTWTEPREGLRWQMPMPPEEISNDN